MARMDLGYTLLKRLEADIKEAGVVESTPERAGNRVHQIFAPPRKGTVAPRKPDAPAPKADGSPKAEASRPEGAAAPAATRKEPQQQA
jgi:hypothetical protein